MDMAAYETLGDKIRTTCTNPLDTSFHQPLLLKAFCHLHPDAPTHINEDILRALYDASHDFFGMLQ
jgi:hypothetical protein